jgi:hypothetical protein
MKIRFLKNWKRGLKPGDVRDLPDGVANLLIKRKLAAEVVPERKPDADPIPEPAPEGGKRGRLARQPREQTALAQAGREG